MGKKQEEVGVDLDVLRPNRNNLAVRYRDEVCLNTPLAGPSARVFNSLKGHNLIRLKPSIYSNTRATKPELGGSLEHSNS